MIQYLRIQNLALLEEAELEFDGGFTCVTGETGAGKSILLGALSFLSGSRTDKSLIRQEAETCAVEAALYLKESGGVDAFLEAQGLPVCEEGVLLLRRSFSRQRIPQIQVNGAVTTLAVLKELGQRWIDFHGPGEPQKLFKEAVQLELLDAYARGRAEDESVATLFQDYRTGYRDYRSIEKRIAEVEGESQLSEDEQEYLRRQIDRMDQLPVEAAAIAAVERDYQRASSSQALKELTGAMMEGLSGEQGVSDQLSDLLRMAQELPELDPESGETLRERLQSLVVEVEDLAESFRDLGEDADFDEEAIRSLEQRMEIWMELRRKYGGSVERVLAERQAIEAKLNLQGDLAGNLARLEKERCQLEKQLGGVADALEKAREAAAEALSEQVVELLHCLGFQNARFQIELQRKLQLSATGGMTCSFRFSPNRGQALQPLNKIASSGETARVMLALKTLLAKVDQIPVLVFDEVDANVGGEIGLEVGRELRRLGDSHQVLCVTHLPQVASQGHRHFVVEKRQDSETTEVRIDPVDGDRSLRVEELARMLGDRRSSSAIEHAENLLGQIG